MYGSRYIIVFFTQTIQQTRCPLLAPARHIFVLGVGELGGGKWGGGGIEELGGRGVGGRGVGRERGVVGGGVFVKILQQYNACNFCIKAPPKTTPSTTKFNGLSFLNTILNIIIYYTSYVPFCREQDVPRPHRGTALDLHQLHH